MAIAQTRNLEEPIAQVQAEFEASIIAEDEYFTPFEEPIQRPLPDTWPWSVVKEKLEKA